MNDLYELFQKLSALEEPLHSATYIQLKSEKPDTAKQLAKLLRHSQTPTEILVERIYKPLLSVDQPESRIGRIIDFKYEIVELIGQGGMSDVYKAIRCDDLIEHEVAVKYFSLAHSFSSALAMLKKEAQILSKLDHHHIASFIDIGYDDIGEPHIMMEYIEGQTLFSFLKKKVDEKTLSRIYITLDEALDYAGKQGVIHGDISQNNVLIDKNGNANIIDFDIAKIFDAKPT
ncbi:MAG: serine/threonine-protein kinase [Bermanella sp.]|jgi:serine/threonine-protein kinase